MFDPGASKGIAELHANGAVSELIVTGNGIKTLGVVGGILLKELVTFNGGLNTVDLANIEEI